MRFAIDARELTGQPTGVGRVVSGLLEAWPWHDDEELVLYARDPMPWEFLRSETRARVVHGPARLPGAVWEQTVLPRLLRRDRVDALFSPAYGMPIGAPCPVIVGMHDCACEATPEEFGWRQRRRRQWTARRASERAAFMLCGSAFAEKEIQRWYDVPAARIARADYGLAATFRDLEPAAVEAARRRYGLDGRTVLFVGAPLGRRNLAGLAATIDELRADRPDIDLCFVGPRHDATSSAADSSVRWLGYVPEEELAAVYAAATVMAYPTTYEGFGFPVLEAMACGTPVVASACGSLPEIFGNHASLVDNDPAAWRTALATLLDDDDLRRQRAAQGQRWALSREWGPASRLLRHLLLRAATNARAQAA